MEMGTEILLARMKEHPEEFINLKDRALGLNDLRWDRVLRDAKEHLPKEDTDALEAGIKQLYIDRFNERVLKTLAGESEPEQTEGTIKYKVSERYSTGFTDSRVLLGTAPSNILAPQSVVIQARQLLEDEFDKAYAEQDRILGLK